MRDNYIEIARSRIGLALRDKGSDDDLSTYKSCVLILGEIIEAIRSDLQTKPFEHTAEEIAFYKEQTPQIWGQYFFYSQLVKIETWRKFRANDKFQSSLGKLLAQTNEFPEKNIRLYEYYYEGRTDKDELLFTRRASRVPGSHIELYAGRDFTDAALKLSYMRSNELLRGWLTKELEQGHSKKMEWLANVTDTVEIFKGLHLIGCFGKSTFKAVMEWVQDVLGVDTRNHNENLSHIRKRKKMETWFVDRVDEALKKDAGPRR